MLQAIIGEWGERHDVIDNSLLEINVYRPRGAIPDGEDDDDV